MHWYLTPCDRNFTHMMAQEIIRNQKPFFSRKLLHYFLNQRNMTRTIPTFWNHYFRLIRRQFKRTMNSHFPPDDHSPVQMSHDANLVATLHPGISRYRSHFINTDDTRLWRWQTISRYDGPFFLQTLRPVFLLHETNFVDISNANPPLWAIPRSLNQKDEYPFSL